MSRSCLKIPCGCRFCPINFSSNHLRTELATRRALGRTTKRPFPVWLGCIAGPSFCFRELHLQISKRSSEFYEAISKSGRLLWGRIFFQPCGRRAEIARGILPWLGMAAMRHDFPALNPDGMIAVRSYEPPSDLLELVRSGEQRTELQSLMRISYAVFCLQQ